MCNATQPISPVEWQKTNQARLHRLANELAEHPDDTLFTRTWKDFYVVVTRKQDYLRLWLMDQENATTTWVQSQMSVQDPLRLTMGYLQAMTAALLWNSNPGRVFVSGIGGGSLPLVLHHHLLQTHFDCVDIAGPVIEAATDYFGLKADARLHIHEGDARHFLENQPDESYDILFLDLYTDSGATPVHLTTSDFFHLCRRKLSAGGVLSMNLYSQADDHDQRLNRIRSVFEQLYLCPVHDSITVVFATDRASPGKFTMLLRAKELQEALQFHFPFAHWLTKVYAYGPSEAGRPVPETPASSDTIPIDEHRVS